MWPLMVTRGDAFQPLMVGMGYFQTQAPIKWGSIMGYAAMVKHFTGIELDKSESRTDWTKRPLTDKQLAYASADVDHLFSIFPKLSAELSQSGFQQFAEQETQNMIEKKFTAIDENELYLNIKMNWRLNSKQLNTLKYLASWRYLQAKKRDLPIGFVAKDNTLMALAQSNPASTSAMLSLEGAEALDVRHKGKAMLSVLAQANKTPESEYPAKVSRLDEYPGYKQTFKKVQAFLVELSEKNGLAIENVASKKQINQFLTWQYKLNGAGSNIDNVDLLANWRAPLFGQPLIEFAQNGYK